MNCKEAKEHDVVVDRRRGDERAEPVAARDQVMANGVLGRLAPGHKVLAPAELERLSQGHQGNAEALRELALVIEARARWKLADTDSLAQRVGDAVVAGHSTLKLHPDAVHRTSVF